jgi:hypothetical protein
MAEAKTPAAMAAETKVEDTPVVEKAPIKKAKDKKPRVKIFIPIDQLNPENTWFCSINGQDYYVKRGEEVEVAWGVAEMYRSTQTREQQNRAKIKVSQL